MRASPPTSASSRSTAPASAFLPVPASSVCTTGPSTTWASNVPSLGMATSTRRPAAASLFTSGSLPSTLPAATTSTWPGGRPRSSAASRAPESSLAAFISRSMA